MKLRKTRMESEKGNEDQRKRNQGRERGGERE